MPRSLLDFTHRCQGRNKWRSRCVSWVGQRATGDGQRVSWSVPPLGAVAAGGFVPIVLVAYWRTTVRRRARTVNDIGEAACHAATINDRSFEKGGTRKQTRAGNRHGRRHAKRKRLLSPMAPRHGTLGTRMGKPERLEKARGMVCCSQPHVVEWLDWLTKSRLLQGTGCMGLNSGSLLPPSSCGSSEGLGL